MAFNSYNMLKTALLGALVQPLLYKLVFSTVDIIVNCKTTTFLFGDIVIYYNYW